MPAQSHFSPHELLEGIPATIMLDQVAKLSDGVEVDSSVL